MNNHDILSDYAVFRKGSIEIDGKELHFREPNAADNDAAFKAMDEGPYSFHAVLVHRCLINEAGAPIFDERDLEAVRKLRPSFLSRLGKAISDLRDDGDAEKNSEPTDEGSSPTA